MLYIPECASEIANDWGDMWEQFYDAAENNFKAAMKYISEHQLQSQFQKRIDIILQNCESSGWGFPDAMWDLMEMEFKTLRLVDCLIIKYPSMKNLKAVTDWLAFNESPDIFNDIRLK